MANLKAPFRFKTISQFHQFRELPKPEHPLISVINLESVKHLHSNEPIGLIFDFYSIALKRNFNAKVKYGQQEYDFDEGIMFFMSPGQVFSIELNKDEELKQTGWMLLVHPDFLWNTPLAKTIKQYEYFSYSYMKPCIFREKKKQHSLASCRTLSRNIIQTLINSART